MQFLETDLPGVWLIEPDVYRDERGFFLETWHQRRYAEAGIEGPFVQDNHSYSARGTLRGLPARASLPPFGWRPLASWDAANPALCIAELKWP